MNDVTLMGQVALTRLRRRERIAAIAEQSHSPIWRRLAREAIASAQSDCRIAGVHRKTVRSAARRSAARRAA
jgi:hypothetical protein